MNYLQIILTVGSIIVIIVIIWFLITTAYYKRKKEQNPAIQEQSHRSYEKTHALFRIFFFDLSFQKFSTLFCMILFPLAVGVSAIIAWVTGGFSLVSNYISDLGSSVYDPYPWLLDFSAMLTAFFFLAMG
jgi:hypothetical membrane protein